MKDRMTGPKTTEEYFDRVKTLCVALLGEGADADSAVLRVFERMNQSEGGICGDADLYRMVYDTVCSISAGRDDTPTDRAIAASLMRNNVRGALGDRAAVLYRHIYQENIHKKCFDYILLKRLHLLQKFSQLVFVHIVGKMPL